MIAKGKEENVILAEDFDVLKMKLGAIINHTCQGNYELLIFKLCKPKNTETWEYINNSQFPLFLNTLYPQYKHCDVIMPYGN